MPTIDIHTHSLSEKWLKLVKEKGKPDLDVKMLPNGKEYFSSADSNWEIHDAVVPKHAQRQHSYTAIVVPVSF